MSAAKKRPPAKDRTSLKVADAAKASGRSHWSRTARMATLLGVLGGASVFPLIQRLQRQVLKLQQNGDRIEKSSERNANALENDIQQRLRGSSSMNETQLNARAKMTILPREDGWEGVITAQYDAAEIFVRMPGQKKFKSLGVSNTINGTTGKPSPNTAVTIKGFPKGMIAIKYTNHLGKEFGPFEVEFDPAKEFVALAKKMMPAEPNELAPVSLWKGKKSITLIQVLMFRAAIDAAFIGPDPQHMDRKLKLGPAPKSPRVHDIEANDPLVSQEIPSAWKNVFLRLHYVDGTSSEALQIQ